ncbi:MAG: FMN-binding protein [Prevotella sp.]|nr:FMN-binding protein [Bacteroidales bacterium]MDY4706471.1 FMN-binding protein [Prevotella sp.]MCI6101567.1 FMN-binding protein [Bacteroidales bacterium]MCI7653353.1 FMN-binding protein [Bacteroidales bacterium]MDD7705046.1 FMN-binding protein [Bacteroidales bacterium]
MNNKTFLAACVGAVMLGAALGFMPTDQNMTKANGQTVVNTTNISRTVRGLNGPTPLKIYIKKDKITKIETLSNRETPDFFNRAKAVLKQYEGKSVKKALSTKVDAVSGATYSSKALIKNVEQGLKYYNQHK